MIPCSITSTTNLLCIYIYNFYIYSSMQPPNFMDYNCYRPVVLNQGQICYFPPKDIWQYLETFLIITPRKVLLLACGQRPGMLLSILQCTGQPLQQRIILSKMAAVLRLRNSTVGLFPRVNYGCIICYHISLNSHFSENCSSILFPHHSISTDYHGSCHFVTVILSPQFWDSLLTTAGPNDGPGFGNPDRQARQVILGG